MMRKNKFLLGIILSFFLLNNSFAEEKIAFIDLNYIYTNSKTGKKIIEEIDKKQSKINKDFKNYQDKLNKEKDDLLSKKNVLEENEFKNILLSLFLLIIGTSITNFYKNKSKDLEGKLDKKKKNILELRKINNLELKENVYLKSPENIQKLANKFLGKDYIFFNNDNIEFFEIDEKK